MIELVEENLSFSDGKRHLGFARASSVTSTRIAIAQGSSSKWMRAKLAMTSPVSPSFRRSVAKTLAALPSLARLVYGIAARSLGEDSAEDLLQEVFMAVWRKAGTFDPRRGDLWPWR